MRALPLALALMLGAELSASTAAAVVVNPGDIIVADARYFGLEGAILHVNPGTGNIQMVASGSQIVRPVDVAFDDRGYLIVVDEEGAGGTGSVIRVNPVNGARTVLSGGGYFSQPHSVVVAPNGDLYVSDPVTGAIIRLDRSEGWEQIWVASGGGFVSPSGLALDPSGMLYVADPDAFDGTGAIFGVDPGSSTPRAISWGGGSPIPPTSPSPGTAT